MTNNLTKTKNFDDSFGDEFDLYVHNYSTRSQDIFNFIKRNGPKLENTYDLGLVSIFSKKSRCNQRLSPDIRITRNPDLPAHFGTRIPDTPNPGMTNV